MIALAAVKGASPRVIRRLVDRYGSAGGAVRAFRGRESPEKISSRLRIPGPVGARIARVRPVGRERLAALERRGIRTVTYGSPGYPPRLPDLVDPPPVLYLQGREPPESAEVVAIVGTRRANPYGIDMTRRIAAGCARAGCAVVSGLARGVDAEAHRATLEARGFTIGVLGSGLDHEYPTSNRPLYRRVREEGLLVSEFEPPTRPSRHTFPRRNRVIAALAKAVVVVQAGGRSGALITADHGLDLGREVLAVPGRADWRVSAGVHRLLRQGAGVVESAEDVLGALEWEAIPLPPAGDPRHAAPTGDDRKAGTGSGVFDAGGRPEARRILEQLADDECSADELVAATGLPPGRAHALLGRLELEGRIASRPGGRFARSAPRKPRSEPGRPGRA